MNRQQRREMAKRKAVENKYRGQMIDHQCMVKQRRVEMDLLCLALSLRHVWGWGQVRIARCMTEFYHQLMRFQDEELIEDLRQELEDETGIYMVLEEECIRFRQRRKRL